MRRIMTTLVFSTALCVGWQFGAWAQELRATTAVSAATLYGVQALISRSGTVKLPAGAHTVIIENLPEFDETTLQVEGEDEDKVKINAIEVRHIYFRQSVEQKEQNGLEHRAIAIQVAAQEATDFNLVVKYQANNVVWGTVYDARLDTTKGLLLLEQFCQVTQTTGEDWQNVAITLLTGMPTDGEEMPQNARQLPLMLPQMPNGNASPTSAPAITEPKMPYLTSWQISLLRPPPTAVSGQVAPDLEQAPNGKSSPAYSVERTEFVPDPSDLPNGKITPAFIAAYEKAPTIRKAYEMDGIASHQEEGQRIKGKIEVNTSNLVPAAYVAHVAEFEVPGKVELKSSATPAKFFVGKVPLKAALHTEVTPRLDKQAYLFAKVLNMEQFPIIPGSVAKYRDGTYIGHAGMSLLRPNELRALSFGIDDRVKVDYQKIGQTQDRPTHDYANDITVERAYETKIRNLHDKPMTITVFDQFPVSADADIKTSLLEDKTTKGFTPDPDKRQGVIQWQTDYKPQEEKRFALAFRVKHRKDTRLENFGE